MNTSHNLQICKKYNALYQSAQSRKLDFSLDVLDVARLLEQTTCYYSGIPISDTQGSPQYLAYNYRTVDRIDSKKGYVTGNVVACCYLMNYLKAVFIEGGSVLTNYHYKLITELPLEHKAMLFSGLVKAAEELHKRLDTNELHILF